MERADGPVRILGREALQNAAPAVYPPLLRRHDRGREKAGVGSCIYLSHPQGGGLRRALERSGYEVHEASYGSVAGDQTDRFDWLPKFRHQLDRILSVDTNDLSYRDGRKNQIVIIKSCFTESALSGEGTPPGNPAGPQKTVWNYRATVGELREEFRKHPQILFVFVTAPPTSPVLPKERLWKVLAKQALGREVLIPARLAEQAKLARSFNTWLTVPDGWLRG